VILAKSFSTYHYKGFSTDWIKQTSLTRVSNGYQTFQNKCVQAS